MDVTFLNEILLISYPTHLIGALCRWLRATGVPAATRDPEESAGQKHRDIENNYYEGFHGAG